MFNVVYSSNRGSKVHVCEDASIWTKIALVSSILLVDVKNSSTIIFISTNVVLVQQPRNCAIVLFKHQSFQLGIHAIVVSDIDSIIIDTFAFLLKQLNHFMIDSNFDKSAQCNIYP